MCGLSVILPKRTTPELRGRLALMHGAIPHRGPDGEGYLLVQGTTAVGGARHEALPAEGLRLGMAFRRLKICDLSDAAQLPLGDDACMGWLGFYGLLNYFRDLRAVLVARGHVFRLHGDT